MKGVVTRKHFLIVLREFGLRVAFKLLLSSKPVALIILMS
jgi:hypothetical protein